ncbi:MAG: hypothetical protein C0506_09470, partial [Anaerolinea sp.]|nr:hypothetical protein [Anaerolinea sp.]
MATTAFDIGSLLESIPGHLDGRPVIAGTRVSVQRIAVLSNEGLTAEEIARDVFGWLSLAQVHAALT